MSKDKPASAADVVEAPRVECPVKPVSTPARVRAFLNQRETVWLMITE